MNNKFRTKAACRIAKVDPQRFNEIASDGTYPCAPATKAGVSRVFDEVDIAALYIFGYLTRVFEPHRFSSKIAGRFASSAHSALRQRTTTNRDRVDIPLNGFNDEFIICNSDDPTMFEGSISTFSFDLNLVLKVVRKRMVEEANILGEED